MIHGFPPLVILLVIELSYFKNLLLKTTVRSSFNYS